jgi:hypothetical protein
LKRLLYILSIAFLFSGCEKEESYSAIPEIEYIDFSASYDNGPLGNNIVGTLTFSFIDGDGNIGFYDNTNPETPTIYDVFIYEYIKVNGEFVLNDTTNYWMPYFEKGIYRTFLKGTIDIELTRIISSEDTARYEFYIQDRAYNISNTETTPIIIYSELVQQKATHFVFL